MILVADSGSTKCDWIIVNNDGSKSEKLGTMGFNPFFHHSDFIASKIRENKELLLNSPLITKVFYYGAGCSTPEFCQIVRQGLKQVFTNAEIHVDHDLAGAVYATCSDSPGIACILGTGSNSCIHDGKGGISEQVPALGYILGDEGSGAYFGRKLLTQYLYKNLPEEIHEKFKERYQLTKQNIFENVYMKPNPNVYMASFMRFMSDNRDNDFVKKFMYKGFSEFITIHIWKYPDYKEIPVHFVGSIAYYFEELLTHEAKIHHLTIGNIVRQPVHNLVDYHMKDL